MKTTTTTLSRAFLVSGCRSLLNRHARLALRVIKQAQRDAANRLPVNIDDLRPWAFIAGVPQRNLEHILQAAAVRQESAF